MTHRHPPRTTLYALMVVSSTTGAALAQSPQVASSTSDDRAEQVARATLPEDRVRIRDETPEVQFAPVAIETAGLLVVMRTAEAYLWPNPFSFDQFDQWGSRYRAAFTQPPRFDTSRRFMEWDGDRWGINVVGHGLLGSELYLRPRRCGFGWLGSLGVTAVASTLWEYGFEANGVRPSGVDLWYTPLSGILFGEARFQLWRLSGKIGDVTWRAVLGAVIDPVGEFSNGVIGAPC